MNGTKSFRTHTCTFRPPSHFHPIAQNHPTHPPYKRTFSLHLVAIVGPELGAQGLGGIGQEGEEEEGRQGREVNPANGRNQATEDVEERVGDHEEGLEHGLAGDLWWVGGWVGGKERFPSAFLQDAEDKKEWELMHRWMNACITQDTQLSPTTPLSSPTSHPPTHPPTLRTWGNQERRMRPVSTRL